jgi:CheY-like chemotaxis protein
MKKLSCILLIDDNEADNYYHSIVIEDLGIASQIQVAQSGFEAIKFLKEDNNPPPELIFLDINMPAMNGWEFLEVYRHIDESRKAQITIVMLSTSDNPEDKKRATSISEISAFTVKPLTADLLSEIIKLHFPDFNKD